MSIRVSHATSCLLRQAVHYLTVSVHVCVSVAALLFVTSLVPALCLFGCASASACARRLSIDVEVYMSRWVRVHITDSLHVRGISSRFRRLNPRVVEAVSVSSAMTQSLSSSNYRSRHGETWGQSVGGGDL